MTTTRSIVELEVALSDKFERLRQPCGNHHWKTRSYTVQGEVNHLNKRSYVTRQPQTHAHTCHWPGCEKQVPPAMWGCYQHWMKLPKYLRWKLWAVFQPGQEITMTPSQGYVAVAREIQDWIKEHTKEGESSHG